MQDRPAGQMVRCSKARAMFASRACRKSVMIGKPLTKKQMQSVGVRTGTYADDALTEISIDCPSYGNDGATMELSSWSTNHATLGRHNNS
jgi:hypothetical protein